MAEEKIETFQDVPIQDEEEVEDHQHTGRDDSLKLTEDTSLETGTGGRYLGLVEKTNVFTTSDTSFTDVTDLTITADVNNRRVMLIFSGCISVDASPSYAHLTFAIDGTDQGGTDGLVAYRSAGNNTNTPVTMIYVTSVLTGKSTFKVRLQSTGGDTTTLNYASSRLIFTAIELTG